MRVLDIVDDFLWKVEYWLIITVLSFMLLMAFIQVALRNFFSTGFIWADVLLRSLVLWLALLGASVATRERKHIAIDVVTRFLSLRKRYIIEIIINAISIYICHLMAFAAWKFLCNERSAASVIALNIPTWIFLLVIPIAFYAMAFRFFLRALRRIMTLVKGVQ